MLEFSKVYDLAEEMSDVEFEQFKGLDKEWCEGRITEDELEQILEEQYGISFAEYYEYFDED